MIDVYIKNGRTIDNEPIEIAIEGDKIVAISKKLQVEAKKIIDLQHKSFISSGWIDAHTHCYEKMSLYYDQPDKIGYLKGVTTVIDAGTTGANNIGDFYNSAQKAKTNVFAMVNISKNGIVRQNELAHMEDIDGELVKESIQKYPDFIVGIKARMSKTVIGENGIEPLKKAKAIQKACNGIPLMVHIGSAPPTLDNVLTYLEEGDIVTHCYNGKENGILNESGEIQESVWDAYHRGVLFDTGHGTDSFNFNVAKQAKSECFICYSLSTDIYHRNREKGPVYDLSTTMEKMLSIGYSLKEILPMITDHPAKMFHLEQKGQLKVGFDADITIFNVQEQEKTLIDSNGNEGTTNQVIQPTYTIVKGKTYEIGG